MARSAKRKSLRYRAVVALSTAMLLLGGCLQPMQVARFDVPTRSENLATVHRTLARLGHRVAQVDPTIGTVTTDWQNTGVVFGELEHQTAYVYQLFSVVIEPAGASSWVTVRVDQQRCASVFQSSVVSSQQQRSSGFQIQGNGFSVGVGSPGASSQHVVTQRSLQCVPLGGVLEGGQREVWRIGNAVAYALRAPGAAASQPQQMAPAFQSQPHAPSQVAPAGEEPGNGDVPPMATPQP